MTIRADRVTGTLSISDLLTDHLAFRDSTSEPGLQLVDIVASAITRAFNGNLGQEGWQRVPYLLAGIEPQVIQYGRMVVKSKGFDLRRGLSGQHAVIMERLYGKRRLVHLGKGSAVPVFAEW